MRLSLSIRTQLTAYVGLFVLLVVGVAVTAIINVSAVDRNAEAISNKWLAGTRILGDLDRHMSAFRLSETDRALALDTRSTDKTEAEANAETLAIDAAFKRYVAIVGDEVAHDELDDFQRVWDDYLVVHDAWIRADAYRHASSLAKTNSSLNWRYKAASKVIDELKNTSYEAADAQLLDARARADSSKLILSEAYAIALILALLISLVVRTRIMQPLGAITAALSRLAAGGVDFSIPEIDRDDEIGAMAKAFEVFRTNAAALEKAHAETRTAQEHAHLLARHDALTGLPNRRVFTAELEDALASTASEDATSMVMLIDLDKFKPVNDVHGHAAGDHVLCVVARRLENITTGRKTVARLGGDEFAIIVDSSGGSELIQAQAMDIAARILTALRDPIQVGEARIEIGASIGIALCPTDGQTPETIIHAADLAMYRAKKDGRDTFRFFEQSMDEELRAQSVLEDSFRHALKNNEIRPYYQPLIGLNEETIHGFEVLARWNHPQLGFVPPDLFVAMAERLGLIADMSALVLRQACRDARDWGDHIRLAVNVSPLQLADPLFPTRLLAILSEEGFKPSRLEVEITESALVGDILVAREILASLQSLGITVSLDDFGTGYSSLYHLRNLKFDKLKIDRSFVQSMQTNAESAKIVDAVLGLARSLGMPVVAEGIEDRTALKHLTLRGCEYGQGFLFSRAIPATDAAQILADSEFRKSA